MEEHIVKIKRHSFYKYGVIKGNIVNGTNNVYCLCGTQEIDREDFDVIDDGSITSDEVYQANSYKEFKSDRSYYLDISERRRYEKAYNRLYKEEIEQSVKAWVRIIDLMNKGEKYEKLSQSRM